MLKESDANRLWQQLFHGQTVTSQTIAEADALVEDMHPESPLRLRLSAELEEIRDLPQLKQSHEKVRFDSASRGHSKS
ncbi:MAG: hypothetical protein RIC12_00855 [Pirellulales bacterium]